MIKRKRMPVAGAVLKIVIGAITIVLILGIFLIISGVRELSRVNKNNSLDPLAIEEGGENLYVHSFYGTTLALRKDQVKNMSISMSDTLTYLEYEEDGIVFEVCLGFIENVDIRKFNEALSVSQ